MKLIWISEHIIIAGKFLKKKNEICPTSNHNFIVQRMGSEVRELVVVLACT